jgi:hypothetical protein
VKELACHSWVRTRSVWLLLVVVAAIGGAACRRGVPVIDTAPKPIQADGTLSGTVRGPEGTSAIDGRTVEVVNLATNVRQRTTTNSAGGFTFKLPPGKYRVELELREGEALVKQPGVIDLNRSDIDAHADFVLGTPRIVKPRYHAPRGDDGLGSAIA